MRWFLVLALCVVNQALAAENGDDGICTVALSGRQNIWNYVPHIEQRCSPGNIIEMFLTVGEPTNSAALLAAIICRFDRPVVIQPNGPNSDGTGICVYRGSARQLAIPPKQAR